MSRWKNKDARPSYLNTPSLFKTKILMIFGRSLKRVRIWALRSNVEQKSPGGTRKKYCNAKYLNKNVSQTNHFRCVWNLTKKRIAMFKCYVKLYFYYQNILKQGNKLNRSWGNKKKTWHKRNFIVKSWPMHAALNIVLHSGTFLCVGQRRLNLGQVSARRIDLA